MKRTLSKPAKKPKKPVEVKPDLSWLDEYEIKHQKQRMFLAALSVTGNPTWAERGAGVTRKAHYEWLKREGVEYDKYRAAAEDARARACENLEMIAHKRATEGIEVKKWHAGKVVGYDNVKSDILLIFLMKGAMPKKYRDNMTLDGKLEGALTLEQIVAAAAKGPVGLVPNPKEKTA